MSERRQRLKREFGYALANAILINALRHALHVEEIQDSDLLDQQLAYAEEIEA